MSVIIWALEVKSPSPASLLTPPSKGEAWAEGDVGLVIPSSLDLCEAEEAMSFRTSVFAKSTEFSCIRRRTWMTHEQRDHN